MLGADRPWLVLALTLSPMLAACGGEPGLAARPLPVPDGRPALGPTVTRPAAVASYRIAATYDAAAHTIRAEQTLRWVNPGRSEVRELPFHLYMNAFKSEATLFMSGWMGEGGPSLKDGRWGWIKVTSIRLDGGPEVVARASFPGPDETVMQLPLDRPVGPGEAIEVAMAFEVQLPEALYRTGYRGDFAMVSTWFPKIGARVGPPGQETWHCRAFHHQSEFFANFGTYDVALTVPDTHVVVATGVLVEARDEAGPTRRLRFHAEAVHDFAWAADPFFESISRTVGAGAGEVEVRVYFRPDQRRFAERHLTTGVAVVETLGQLVMPYPWAHVSIIDPPPEALMSVGAMEYATVVVTAADTVFAPEGVRWPEVYTAHEVAHSWFPGILGTDEVGEAWLDEGLAEYMADVVLEKIAGARTTLVDWAGLRANTLEFGVARGGSFGATPDPIATRSFEFVDSAAYGAASYVKMSAALRTLEKLIGRERFFAGLRRYAQKHAFGHPRGADLVAALEEEAGQELDWFFGPVLGKPGAADLRVRSVGCRPGRAPRGAAGQGEPREASEPRESAPTRCAVVVENLGRVPVPVDVELTFAGGERVRHRWDDRGAGPRWHRFDVEHAQPVVQVVIDPDRHVLLDDGGVHRGWRAEADAVPVRRAAAHAQFWAQTAIQVLGL